MAHDFLTQTVAIVVASAVIAYVCQRLRVLPIVGFLLAGVAIGPNALGLVESASVIEVAGEIGVVLLLFTLGLEFSLDRLARIKRAIFAGGGLQVTLTIVAAAAVLAAFNVEWRTGVFTGSLIALSSTAIVLKVLGDSGETASRKGQLALGMLIFQDFAIIVLAMIVPMLGGSGGSALGLARAVVTAIVIIVVIVVIARRVMPVILERVARTCSQEIFLLTIIAICLGTAYLTSLAGVSLSLGAFLAGLVVSDGRYSHHAFAEIMPLQILFSAIFFVSVGLLLDLSFVLHNPLLVIGVALAVIALKVVVAATAALLLRYPLGTAVSTAMLVAQIGEFSFVLERVGASAGLHPAGFAQGGPTFIAVAVLLMVVTPLLAKVSRMLETRIETPKADALPDEPERTEPASDLDGHVIIGGYGHSARCLARALRRTGVPFIIVTLSPTGATEAENDGFRVLLGDYSRGVVLGLAGVDRARLLVVADDVAEMATRVTAVARQRNPLLRIFLRTHSVDELSALLTHGADDVLVDELEIGIELFTRVLEEWQTPEGEIEDLIANVRAEAIRDAGTARVVRLTDEQRRACEHAASVKKEVASPATGCSECMKTGDDWVHLRICMTCAEVRCCDSSKNQHMTKHNHATGHPVIRSFDEGELWAWCYVDRMTF
jgi:K+:H+ antiporter